MMDFSCPDRIFELELETLRGSYAAMHRKRAAKHQETFRNGILCETRKQILRVQNGADRAFLIERARTVNGRIRAQQQTVPMRRHGLEAPEGLRNRFLAHLLRN